MAMFKKCEDTCKLCYPANIPFRLVKANATYQVERLEEWLKAQTEKNHQKGTQE